MLVENTSVVTYRGTMHTSLARRLLIAGVVLATLALGGVQASTGSPVPLTAQSGGEADVPDVEAPAPATVAPESESRIRMWNDTFYYDYVFVPPGTTITWVNEEPDPTNAHNILAEDGSFASPLVLPGESWQYTFTTPGYYRYFCELHDGMEGAVLVEGE
jgi:plastocyanin